MTLVDFFSIECRKKYFKGQKSSICIEKRILKNLEILKKREMLAHVCYRITSKDIVRISKVTQTKRKILLKVLKQSASHG